MIEVILISSLIVGVFVGVAGIAGFMLPIVFTTILNMELYDALALSFLAILTGGVIGTRVHIKKGNMIYSIAIPLAIGSFVGAIFGSRLNLFIDVIIGKALLNSVVLLSGISLLRKQKEVDKAKEKRQYTKRQLHLMNIVLGIVVGGICSLTGAGGPILTIPLLVVLGIELKYAIGISILNSIAIAIPACIVYLSKSQMEDIALLSGITIISQAIGMIIGTKIMDYVSIKWLRRIVSGLAIVASLYNLIMLI